ncbi:MAG: hypothetical protein IID44_22605 [Planctomycetes bacterium]|nr:hypothetical protein [Planctomycetota bacterium]
MKRNKIHLLTICCLSIALWSPAIGSTARADEPWAEQRQIGPFAVHSQFSLKDHVGLFADLKQIQQDLKRCLAIGDPRAPIQMYLFADKANYRRFIEARFPKAPDRPALFIKSGGVCMVFAYQSKQFEIDVRHETTHALLHADLPMVPLWLDEGLAEYFEVAPKDRALGNSYLGTMRLMTQFGIAPKITSLEKKANISEMGGSHYRYCWAWVHFMLHGPREAHGELVRYLADIRAMTPPGQLSDRLSRRIPRLNKQFVKHFRTWQR